MIYGLTGASGSGKSTLARDLADALDMEMIETSITASGLKHGIDPVSKMSLSSRIALQHHLLADHVEKISAVKKPAIADRTPIDMISYMLCQFDMHSGVDVDPSLLKMAADYAEKCILATQRFYDMVFMIGCLDHYEEKATRPSFNPAYQLHSDLVMRGALVGARNLSHAIVTTQSRAERFECVSEVIIERLDANQALRNKSAHVN